jgi:hypothetical protein
MEVPVVIDFFHSHAGKGLAGVVAAVFLLAWPPALPWVAAVVFLQFGVRHLVLAFREVDREAKADTCITAGAPSLPAPDSKRRVALARRGAVPARPSLD